MVYFSCFLTSDGHRDFLGKMVAITHTEVSPRVEEGRDRHLTDQRRYRLEGDTSVAADGFDYAV